MSSRSLPRRIAGRLKRMVRPPVAVPDESDAAAHTGYDAANAEDTTPEPAPAPLPPPVLHDITGPPTMLDPNLQGEFASVGYSIVDLITPEEAAELLALAHEVHPAKTGHMWESDFYSPDLEVKRKVAETLQAVVQPAIDRHLVDHEMLIQNFVVNWPGPRGGLELHQHSSITDETRFRGAVIWLALHETSLENGTLNVVPQSHRVLGQHKAERTPEWFEGLHEHLCDNHLETVVLKPGQALVFDNAVLHNSYSNITDDPRMTAVMVVAPRAAALRYYDYVDDGTVRIYELEPEFFLQQVAATHGEWAAPEGLEPVGEEHIEVRRLTAEETLALLPHGTAGKEAEALGTRQPHFG
jgi:ectoine hydroxylase-related dioxygenase (phytanoyl-CoA dioxygenase family)